MRFDRGHESSSLHPTLKRRRTQLGPSRIALVRRLCVAPLLDFAGLRPQRTSGSDCQAVVLPQTDGAHLCRLLGTSVHKIGCLIFHHSSSMKRSRSIFLSTSGKPSITRARNASCLPNTVSNSSGDLGQVFQNYSTTERNSDKASTCLFVQCCMCFQLFRLSFGSRGGAHR
jgi:hypothetical protein